jgi:hypothetical protein
MREVTIGGERVILMGAAFAPLIYEDEFAGADMAAAIQRVGDAPMTAGKLAYAMARCAKYPSGFPDYQSWIKSIGGWDPSDGELMKAVVLEAMRACFPHNPGLVSAAEERLFPDAVRASAEPELPRDGQEDGPVAD